MKLSKVVVQRRVKLLEDEGIQFKTNANIGKDVKVKVHVISLKGFLSSIFSIIQHSYGT